MPHRFHFNRSLQSAAFLLRKAGPAHTENYMKILKLLYIADRTSIAQTGSPITGDRFIAMKRGPVLSHVLDLVRGRHLHSAEWAKFIETDRYNIRLCADPGEGDLSRYEMDLLTEVWEENRLKDEWQMVEETHRFPEWIKNKPEVNSSKKIPFEDVLDAVGMAEHGQAIERDAEEEASIRRVFGD